MIDKPAVREPAFNAPATIVVSVGVLLGIHALRSFLPGVVDFQILRDFAFFPAEWTAWFDPATAPAILKDAAAGSRAADETALAQYLLGRGLHPWTILSHAFLHASWAHVALNAVWLAAFGTPLVRRCGGLRFALIALLSVIGGILVFRFAEPTSVMPVIGASAAVSGIMGAAAYFIFAPPYEQVHDAAGAPLRPSGTFTRLLRNRTALAFLGLWLVSNLIFGLGSQSFGVFDGQIAWQAHLGGLLTGLIVFPAIDRWRGGQPGDGA